MSHDNLSSRADATETDELEQPGSPRGEALIESARLGSGISTVYEALDRLVDLYALDDLMVTVGALGLRFDTRTVPS